MTSTRSTPSSAGWPVLVVLMLSVYITIVDSTLVGIAIPSLILDLGISAGTGSAVISTYVLAFGAGLIPIGFLVDRVGARPVFIAGSGLFALSSLAVGTASDQSWFLIARGIQGVGGALAWVPVGVLLRLAFQGSRQVRAFSVYGAVIGAATASGPLVGGVLLHAAGGVSGWRWAFWSNGAVGVVVVVLATFFLRVQVEPARKAATAPVGLIRPGQWTVFVGGLSAVLFTFGGFTSLMVVFSISWQQMRGAPALETALALTPFAVATTVASLASGRVDRVSRGNASLVGAA